MISIHAGFAYVTGEEAWNLGEEDEAKEYAKALRRVSDHYGIKVSAKTDALLALGAVAGKIYFRRFQYFAARRRESPPAEATAPAEVSLDATQPAPQAVQLAGGLTVVGNHPGG